MAYSESQYSTTKGAAAVQLPFTKEPNTCGFIDSPTSAPTYATSFDSEFLLHVLIAPQDLPEGPGMDVSRAMHIVKLIPRLPLPCTDKLPWIVRGVLGGRL